MKANRQPERGQHVFHADGAAGEEEWVFIDTETAVLRIGEARLAITTCRGLTPDGWWRSLWRAQQLAEVERLAAGRLEALAPAERDRLAREALDDGSSGGGWLLIESRWPAEIRLRVLRALVERVGPGETKRVLAAKCDR